VLAGPNNAGIHVINTAHFGMTTPEVLQDDDPIDDAPDAPATSQMSKRAMLRDLRRRQQERKAAAAARPSLLSPQCRNLGAENLATCIRNALVKRAPEKVFCVRQTVSREKLVGGVRVETETEREGV
jgi:hypothetical protein